VRELVSTRAQFAGARECVSRGSATYSSPIFRKNIIQTNATANCTHETVSGKGKVCGVMISLLKKMSAIEMKK